MKNYGLFVQVKALLIWVIGLITAGTVKAGKAALADVATTATTSGNSSKLEGDTKAQVVTASRDASLTAVRAGVSSDWNDLEKVEDKVAGIQGTLNDKIAALENRALSVEGKVYRGKHAIRATNTSGFTLTAGAGVYEFYIAEDSPELPKDETTGQDENVKVIHETGFISLDNNDIMEVVADENGAILSITVQAKVNDNLDVETLKTEILAELGND